MGALYGPPERSGRAMPKGMPCPGESPRGGCPLSARLPPEARSSTGAPGLTGATRFQASKERGRPLKERPDKGRGLSIAFAANSACLRSSPPKGGASGQIGSAASSACLRASPPKSGFPGKCGLPQASRKMRDFRDLLEVSLISWGPPEQIRASRGNLTCLRAPPQKPGKPLSFPGNSQEFRASWRIFRPSLQIQHV